MGKGTPDSMPVTVVSGLAYAEVRDSSHSAVAKALPAWQRLWAVLQSRASLRAEQGAPTVHSMHWPSLQVPWAWSWQHWVCPC